MADGLQMASYYGHAAVDPAEATATKSQELKRRCNIGPTWLRARNHKRSQAAQQKTARGVEKSSWSHGARSLRTAY